MSASIRSIRVADGPSLPQSGAILQGSGTGVVPPKTIIKESVCLGLGPNMLVYSLRRQRWG